MSQALNFYFASLLSARSRYFQSQRSSDAPRRIWLKWQFASGLFYVQPKIILYVAPINCLTNYILGQWFVTWSSPSWNFLVWGPESIRLGFIGAPVATVVSYYLISIVSLIYGRYLVPQTAWQPLSTKMFHDLGILARLGSSGVGMSVVRFSRIYLPPRFVYSSTSGLYMVGLGMCRTGYILVISNTFLLEYCLNLPFKAWVQMLSHVSRSWYRRRVSLSKFSPQMRAPPRSGELKTIVCGIHYSFHHRVGNLLGERNAIRANAASSAGVMVALWLAGITRYRILRYV